MTGFVPDGMVPLHVALGQVARTWFPDDWGRLKEEDRELFEQASGSDWRRARFRPSFSLGRQAYDRLRPLAVDGSLPMLMHTSDRGPAGVMPEAWQARSADSLDAVVCGTARMKLGDGESVAGPILLRSVDLDAVLRGKPAPSLLTAPAVEPASALPSPPARPRAGRPTNPEGDAFWVEVTRRMLAGEGQGGQAKLTATMSQWCIDNMHAPYDGETVRKKLGRLFGAIGSE